jgi:hypothetical protein
MNGAGKAARCDTSQSGEKEKDSRYQQNQERRGMSPVKNYGSFPETLDNSRLSHYFSPFAIRILATI